MFKAHSKNIDGNEHPLKTHLQSTAKIAESLARNDEERIFTKYVGLFHDAGKYQKDFQEYLEYGGLRGSVPHAAFGAALVREYSSVILPFCIEGHHKGLANRIDLKLNLIEYEQHKSFLEVKQAFESEIQNGIGSDHDLDKIVIEKYRGKEFELFIRYLFSILTDADWLDTEKHFGTGALRSRYKLVLDVERMIAVLEKYFTCLPKDGKINKMRNEVRTFAVSKVNLPVGFFSLNLPTGMGKTLTSFYWALCHAKANALQRIIIVLPYINIIDQTAQVLKDIFGEEWILEHHSAISEREVDDDDNKEYNRKKLACENWDYPVIVTTTVQFFESLFGNKPSQCRKIHNIADSVVIFDEVQTFPKHLAQPSLTMLKNFSVVMHTSFLFCTATQPAFQKWKGFDGIEHITPLVESPAAIFNKTRRVEYTLIDNLQPIDSDRLLEMVCSQNHSALVIFNTKRETRYFFNKIRNRGAFESIYHLSTSMCADHRKIIIEHIHRDLSINKRIAVCSTQLIEAGVDFDFPVVFRAIAPLESIIQSAGRCNREGKMRGQGKVFLFKLENADMPDSLYRTMTQYAESMISDNIDLLHRHNAYEAYYRQVVSLFVDPDRYKIEKAREEYKFKTVSESYKLIKELTISLLVKNYNQDSQAAFQAILYKPLTMSDIRKMQPFIVQVYPNFENKYHNLISKTDNGISVWCGQYDYDTGIVGNVLQVDQFIV